MIVLLQCAAELLKKGEIVAFPTETVYGLGALIFDPDAVAKIFKAKGRPSDNPLIAHICSLTQVDQIARDIPELFYDYAKQYFPGPLTIVLKKHPNVPSIVSGGLDTIAIRMPAHPIANQLIQAVGQPIVAPSANLSGKPSSTEVSHVIADFEGKIAGVIDGGPCHYGIESTVISLIDEPCILRLGSLHLDLPLATSEQQKSSPGTRYRHYAPKATVRLFSTAEELASYSIERKYCVIEPKASNLYSLLRQADEDGFEEILVLCTTTDRALLDRLYKSSGY